MFDFPRLTNAVPGAKFKGVPDKTRPWR